MFVALGQLISSMSNLDSTGSIFITSFPLLVDILLATPTPAPTTKALSISDKLEFK